jgi:hypothetical protein
VKAYYLYHADKFPQAGCHTPEQMTHEAFEEYGSSSISKAGTLLGFEVYHGRHDLRVEKSGRQFRKNFTWYFEPHEFPIYLWEPTSLLLLSTKHLVASSFIECFESRKLLKLRRVHVDYKTLMPRIQEISGAWVAELGHQHLSSTAVFGAHVDRSEEFQAAVAKGKLKSLIFTHAMNDSHRVAITARGGVVIYRRYDSPATEIRVIIDVYNTYMAPSVGQQIELDMTGTAS